MPLMRRRKTLTDKFNTEDDMTTVSPMMPKKFRRRDDPKVLEGYFESPERRLAPELKQLWANVYCAAIANGEQQNASFIADRAVDSFKQKFNL